MMEKGDVFVYIGEPNELFDTGDELTLIEDLSEAAKAGMNNAPEQILLSCMSINAKGPSIGLVPMSSLKAIEKK